MEDFGISINNNCPCTQQKCPIRGNCVLCIQNHLVHKRHIPECVQNILRPIIKELSRKMEFEISEARPTQTFWESFDNEHFIKETLKKHITDDNLQTEIKEDNE